MTEGLRFRIFGCSVGYQVNDLLWVVSVVCLVDPFEGTSLNPINSKLSERVFKVFVVHGVHVIETVLIGRCEWSYCIDIDRLLYSGGCGRGVPFLSDVILAQAQCAQIICSLRGDVKNETHLAEVRVCQVSVPVT
jgi:hypothetical protein